MQNQVPVSQNRPVTGRFAPSPSGRMHLGNLCCALLAWLSVRSQNGEMLLRIEDLDPDRCTREKAELLMDDLTWLGLTWDEGPGHERTHAPYCQSARRELYESALSELRAKNDVYPCFCTRAELHAVSAPHAGDGTFRYPGLCRNLTPAEAEEKSRTRRPSLRFRAPEDTVTFEDLYCKCSVHVRRFHRAPQRRRARVPARRHRRRCFNGRDGSRPRA